MAMNKLISLNQEGTLKFMKLDEATAPKATLMVTNNSQEQNTAYKIKTTAPKLFVVKPIQGIIAPGRSVQVEIQIQAGQITTFADLFKNKFMVQASATDLQSSENFKLSKFWDEKNAMKDKS